MLLQSTACGGVYYLFSWLLGSPFSSRADLKLVEALDESRLAMREPAVAYNADCPWKAFIILETCSPAGPSPLRSALVRRCQACISWTDAQATELRLQ